jgi:hypothetical protein
MTIFYTASYYGKSKYQKHYDSVLKAIESTEVDIISPEKNNYLNLLSEKEKARLQDNKLIHYEAIRKGINIADGVIIEISNEDFQLGHEATLAIQSKKPVLCLSINEDYSEKINNRYFFGAKYNEKNISKIIANFIKSTKSIYLSERFNMFLAPAQLRHLDENSKKANMNKSEYIRRLIDQDRGAWGS